MHYLKNVVAIQVDEEKCTGCGICLEVCPRGVIALQGGVANLQRKDDCLECGACRQNCAYGAISLRTGPGCAYAVINGWLQGTEPNCDCGSGCC